MKKAVLLLILTLLLLCSVPAFADSVAGFVNIEQILAQSVKLQVIQKNFTAYQTQVITDFEREKKTLSEDDAKIRAVAYQEDINMHEQMAAARLDASIRTAINLVAKKRSLGLVVNNTATYFGCADITEEVINTIDAGQN